MAESRWQETRRCWCPDTACRFTNDYTFDWRSGRVIKRDCPKKPPTAALLKKNRGRPLWMSYIGLDAPGATQIYHLPDGVKSVWPDGPDTAL